jgi:hypothetical protein
VFRIGHLGDFSDAAIEVLSDRRTIMAAAAE